MHLNVLCLREALGRGSLNLSQVLVSKTVPTEFFFSFFFLFCLFVCLFVFLMELIDALRFPKMNTQRVKFGRIL